MGFLYSQLFVRPQYPTKSFAGQTVIVTGSNVGLGKEAARHIARLGVSKLILAVRNVDAGEEAKGDIESTTNCGKMVIEVWQLDLSSYGESSCSDHLS
jgi:NAD(P)-dependent dehydrogenase (short-subunit alcohol dehydrogenase family)